ncbi:MAG: multicopper oxidase domain-containing protein [Gemmatimonadota bacterium]|nr:multicopper oxidase domain-containing protein [Gemmatimonadota bacterium]
MQTTRLIFLAGLGVTSLAVGGAGRAPHRATTERIAPNDNVQRAGHLSKGVLTVAIDARDGEWRPEEADGAVHKLAAFSVAGGPLLTPGPLLRVPVGTEIRVTMHNTLAVPMWVYGFGERHGFADSAQLAAGETRELRFRATTPGLSYYAGRTTADKVGDRNGDDSQLNGAIVIDPLGVTPNDRIFLISSWYTIDPKTVSGLGPNSMITFNGLGWPHTPRIDLVQGDTVHWRFVNLSSLDHPIHLHGTYFRVDAKGDGQVDSIYASEDQRLAVTELVLAGQTMSTTWAPLHSGNWILHCHFASHMTRSAMFEEDRRMPSSDAITAMAAMPHDEQHLQHMASLVIGIRVRPRGRQDPAQPVSQQLRLLVRSRARVYGEYAGYGFVLGNSPSAAMRDSFTVPGPTLELTRGKRVAVTIVNQAHEPVAVHWHGIELESFPDGVPGWSGSGATILPHIMPGDSLTVRFTPPRAGTFMYHSHSNEMQQISSGLYGAIIVREPGAKRDSAERTLLFSDGGPTVSFFKDSPPVLLNGKVVPDTIDVPAGQPTRLRMINIRTENLTDFALEQNGAPVQWRALAKDGADLPPHQRRVQPAMLTSAPGEINDFEITPAKPGIMILRFLGQPGDTTTTQRAVIRAH